MNFNHPERKNPERKNLFKFICEADKPELKPLVASEISSKEKHFQVGLGESSMASTLLKLSLLSSTLQQPLGGLATSSKLLRLSENSLFRLFVLMYFISGYQFFNLNSNPVSYAEQ